MIEEYADTLFIVYYLKLFHHPLLSWTSKTSILNQVTLLCNPFPIKIYLSKQFPKISIRYAGRLERQIVVLEDWELKSTELRS